MNPWDQQPGEPDAAYMRFLIYLKLGPTRTLLKAYHAYCEAKGGPAKPHRPGSWQDDSVKWRWVERAQKWDIDQLNTVLPQFAIRTLHLINQMSECALEALESGQIKPKNWDDLVKVTNTLASYLSAETITALRDSGRSGPDVIDGEAEEHLALVEPAAGSTDDGVSDGSV